MLLDITLPGNGVADRFREHGPAARACGPGAAGRLCVLDPLRWVWRQRTALRLQDIQGWSMADFRVQSTFIRNRMVSITASLSALSSLSPTPLPPPLSSLLLDDKL